MLLGFFSVSTPSAADRDALSGAPSIELGTEAPAAPSKTGVWLKRLYETSPPAMVLPAQPVQAEDTGAYSAQCDGTDELAYFPGEAALLLLYNTVLEGRAQTAVDVGSEFVAATTSLSGGDPALCADSAAHVADAVESSGGQVDSAPTPPPPLAPDCTDSAEARKIWDPGGQSTRICVCA
jgi:hypothetical protein